MTKIDERISALEDKLKQLKARQQRLDNRRRAVESRRARKADTRKKILLGAIVLARLEQGRLQKTDVNGWLDEALTRADDRALFELPARSES